MNHTDNEQNGHEPTFEEFASREELRREAGEGWLPGGINNRVLGAIIVRERMWEKIRRENLIGEPSVVDGVVAQSNFVEQLKHELGVGEPPVMALEGIENPDQ